MEAESGWPGPGDMAAAPHRRAMRPGVGNYPHLRVRRTYRNLPAWLAERTGYRDIEIICVENIADHLSDWREWRPQR